MKWILPLLAAMILTAPARAQRPVRLGLSSRSPVAAAAPARIRVGSAPPSRWAEGMVIGGIIGAALGALLNHAGSGISDVAHNDGGTVILVSAALGALIGGMIGARSHPAP